MMDTERSSGCNTDEFEWDVEGPDPIPWPGSNFEMICDLPGFVHPERAAQILTAALGGDIKWTLDRPERAGVERIYTFKREESPLEVRARLGGMGVHPDADQIDYVLEFKVLHGAQTNGSYQELEVTRGTFGEVASAASEMHSLIDGRFSSYCKFEPQRPIVANLDEVQSLIEQVKRAKI